MFKRGDIVRLKNYRELDHNLTYKVRSIVKQGEFTLAYCRPEDKFTLIPMELFHVEELELVNPPTYTVIVDNNPPEKHPVPEIPVYTIDDVKEK